jgi:hypothetical protein
MDLMSKSQEDKLVNATQTAIQYTRDGLEPNQALEKVARDEQLSPEHIKRMTQGFNKAKSVHVMKEASQETRAQSFSLADSDKIINEIFAPREKVASTTFEIPSVNLAERILRPQEDLQKVASASIKEDIPVLTASSYHRKYRMHCDFMDNMVKVASNEIATHKLKMQEAFSAAADDVSRMHDKEIQKVAQLVVNGYGPTYGNNILKIIGSQSRKDIQHRDKTASAAVFPNTACYSNIQKAYSHAHKMVDAEVWKRHLTKEAGIGQTFLANAAAELVTDPLTGKQPTEPNAEVEMDLNAKHYNADKALQAKRALYTMMNSDEFVPYDHSQVIKAWNSVSSEYPDLMQSSPAAARKLMLENLEGVGARDISEIQQIEKINQGSS